MKHFGLSLTGFLFLVAFTELSAADLCDKRPILAVPSKSDILLLKSPAHYDVNQGKRVKRDVTLTTSSREIPCSESLKAKNFECFSVVHIRGDLEPGATLNLPRGTVFSVSRQSRSPKVTFIHAKSRDLNRNKNPALIQTRSGTFQLMCSRRIERVHVDGSRTLVNSKVFSCFNEDVDLLFENLSLKKCLKKERYKKISRPYPKRKFNLQSPDASQESTGSVPGE